jgi:hypothetical protein
MLRDNRFFFADTWIFTVPAFLFAALVLLPDDAYAVPQYYASIPGIETVSASTPVFLSNRTERVDHDGGGNVIGQATHEEIAAASYGQVRGNGNADYLNVHPYFPIFSGAGTGSQEDSSFMLDDLVISGPPGNINVSFNFVVSGSIGTSIVITGDPAYYAASAEVQAFISYQGATGGGGPFGVGQMGVYKGQIVSQSGIFSTFPNDVDGMAMGTTPLIPTFAGDTALAFGLRLVTSTSASVGYGGEPGSANGHASFVLGLPTSGPVANLPEGYTLNSLSGHIVNNQFVAPDLFGDYNGDGTVDAADYVFWRKTGGSSQDYNIWRAHFGKTTVSGAANDSTASSGTPEPTSLALLLLAASASMTRRPGRHISPIEDWPWRKLATMSALARRTYLRDSNPGEGKIS